ncbi:MAG: hypothetical protein WDN46_21190 [Methylocella sp.]
MEIALSSVIELDLVKLGARAYMNFISFMRRSYAPRREIGRNIAHCGAAVL